MLYLFLANGFEETEAIATIDIVRRAGLGVTVCSIAEKEVTGSHGIIVIADKLESECNFSDLEGVILPGGIPGTNHLEASDTVKKQITLAMENQKLVAAICAAPTILAHMGLLEGKNATVYPTYKQDMIQSGALYREKTQVCGNIITANGMGKTIDFALAIVSYFSGAGKAKEILEKI